MNRLLHTIAVTPGMCDAPAILLPPDSGGEKPLTFCRPRVRAFLACEGEVAENATRWPVSRVPTPVRRRRSWLAGPAREPLQHRTPASSLRDERNVHVPRAERYTNNVDESEAIWGEPHRTVVDTG